jgi:hypothetical protein
VSAPTTDGSPTGDPLGLGPSAAIGSTETDPRDPAQRFSAYLTTYFSALGLIVAALPFALRATDSLEFYSAVKGWLAFLASLISYFAVAVVFSGRHYIGRSVFLGMGLLDNRRPTTLQLRTRALWTFFPAVLGTLSIVSFVMYAYTLNLSAGFVILNSTYADSSDEMSLYEIFRTGSGPTRLVGQYLGKQGPDFAVVGEAANYSGGHALRYTLPTYNDALMSTAPGQIPSWSGSASGTYWPSPWPRPPSFG